MQRIHKTLAICLLVTALVFGVLKILGGVGFGAEGRGDENASSRDSMTRHERGEKESDSSTRKFRQRARKLNSDEATEFLNTTIIPEIHFKSITLEEALKIVNEEIAKQTPDDQPRPRIMLDPVYLAHTKKLMDSPPDGLLGAPGSIGQQIIDELKVRNIPASMLLKYIGDKTYTRYGFYKGDFYVGINVQIEDPSIFNHYSE